MRTPLAKSFDRNCVLAATAGQLIAAETLGLQVRKIVVGETVFKVGKVAKDIKLAAPAVDRQTAVVAMAGSVGFALAADRPFFDGLDGGAFETAMEAFGILAPWIADGRFAELVTALDAYRCEGKRVLQ